MSLHLLSPRIITLRSDFFLGGIFARTFGAFKTQAARHCGVAAAERAYVLSVSSTAL